MMALRRAKGELLRTPYQACSLCVRAMGGVTMREIRANDSLSRRHEPRRHGPKGLAQPMPSLSSHRQPCFAGLKSRSDRGPNAAHHEIRRIVPAFDPLERHFPETQQVIQPILFELRALQRLLRRKRRGYLYRRVEQGNGNDLAFAHELPASFPSDNPTPP